jgi:hypothetical protein
MLQHKSINELAQRPELAGLFRANTSIDRMTTGRRASKDFLFLHIFGDVPSCESNDDISQEMIQKDSIISMMKRS